MLIKDLLEQNTQSLRSKPASWADFLDAVPLLQTSLDALDRGAKIYRGLEWQDEPLLFKPQMHKGSRASANIENYYTLFIDNNESWQSYPPRSASVVASTDRGYARQYGYTYLLLPEGDPAVGVCSGVDFWESFPHLSQEIPQIINMEDLVMALKNIFSILLPSTAITNYKQLQEQLGEVDRIWQEFKTASPESLIHRGLLDISVALLQYKDYLSMEEKLSQLLDPRSNNFAQLNWKNLDVYAHGEYEVWFSAPVWMLNTAKLPVHITKEMILKWAKSQAQHT
jgi:hypothetical protein